MEVSNLIQILSFLLEKCLSITALSPSEHLFIHVLQILSSLLLVDTSCFWMMNRKVNLGVWRWSPSNTEAKVVFVIQAEMAPVGLTYISTKPEFITPCEVLVLASSSDRESVAQPWLLSCSVFAHRRFKLWSPAKAGPRGQQWISRHWHTDSWAIQSSPARMSHESLVPLAQPGLLPQPGCQH